MRTNIQILFVLTVLVMIATLSSCKKDKDPQPQQTEADRVRALLTAGTWTMQSVTVDGVDQTALFTGLTITFTKSGFTAVNGAPVWPASGTWSFTDDSGTTIVRGDGIQVTIKTITENSLTLTLVWDNTTLGPGRTTSIGGLHVFLFSR